MVEAGWLLLTRTPPIKNIFPSGVPHDDMYFNDPSYEELLSYLNFSHVKRPKVYAKTSFVSPKQ